MTQFISQGQNINGNSASGVYVNILNPQGPTIQGTPENLLGIVGIGIYGPKNVPTIISGVNDGSLLFGPPRNVKYDIMTAVAIAAQQGVSNFRIVRVTDGTDTAASAAIKDVTSGTAVTGMTLTAIYTGSYGSNLKATISQGTSSTIANPTYMVSIALPNSVPEVFDNIGGTGAAIWTNMVNAINNGQSGQSGASQLVVATVGIATLAPALASYSFTGGTDGNTTITDSVLIGSDTYPRTGMYALRGTECTCAMLADVTTDTTFPTQAAFAATEGIQMWGAGPAGQTDAQAITSRQTVAIDSTLFKYVVGDYCYWNDTYNNIPNRLVSPQAPAAGLRAALSPDEPSFNKPLQGIFATQSTLQRKKRLKPEIGLLKSNGLDVIYAPSDGGAYLSLQTGVTTSSNPLTRWDNYATLTYYIARSVGDAIGIYVGQKNTPDLRLQIKHSIDSFLQQMADDGMIGATNGGRAFIVTVTSTDQQAEEGIVIISIQVANFPPINDLVVNLQNGNITLNP